MTDRMGVAIIGTGFWGRRMAQAIERGSSLRTVTCYSRSDDKRAKFAADFNCEAADSFEAAIDHPDVAGVLLITPNNIHADGVEACAARGKHVFLEKPIADTMEDSYRIQAIAEETGITLLVGHAFRRLGAARKVRELLDQSALGTVVLVEANFTLPGTLTPDKWRYYRETCPGGPLMQLGVHHADTLQYWLGPVESVMGTFAHLSTNAEIDDVGVVALEFASGVRGTLTGSYVSPKTYYLRLFGSEASLMYETDMTIWPDAPRMDPSTTLTLIQKSGEKTNIEFDHRDMLVDELEEFAAAARGEAAVETGADEAIQAVKIILGALASHETGTRIQLDTL